MSKHQIESEPVVVSVPGFTNGLNKIERLFVPKFIKNLAEKKQFSPRSSDTFVIGYPKSGTTWVEEICYLILNDLDYAKAEHNHQRDRIIFFDLVDPNSDSVSNQNSPRLFKSHLPVDYMCDKIENKCKIVYVVRNPKDLLVSLYNFRRRQTLDEFTGSFDEFTRLFLEGKVQYGAWWKHVDSYASRSNIHLVRYEELLERPVEKVKDLCRYLNREYSTESLEKLIRYCSFESMKLNKNYNKNICIESKLFKSGMEFFRKGQIGDWANYFDESTARDFDNNLKRKIKRRLFLNYAPTESQKLALTSN